MGGRSEQAPLIPEKEAPAARRTVTSCNKDIAPTATMAAWGAAASKLAPAEGHGTALARTAGTSCNEHKARRRLRSGVIGGLDPGVTAD